MISGLMLGMITRELTDPSHILAFLENAEMHERSVDRVIVSVSGAVSSEAARVIASKVPLEILTPTRPDPQVTDFVRRGLTESQARFLFAHPVFEASGAMPYGPNRNSVVLAAIRAGGEVLFFADSDVLPSCLQGTPQKPYFKTVDVFGHHLTALSDPEVMVSTSDYSGYYIIPPMEFEGVDLFLEGLQKEAALDFLKGASEHHMLTLDAGEARQPFETDKILGGNVAMKLELFRHCLPFFSSAYCFNGSWRLTRGEDTLLGQSLKAMPGHKVVDLDLRLFHDTFDNYPEIPDIRRDTAVQDRFFTTCLGWIGRNPILNALAGKDAKEIAKRQHDCLVKSVPAASAYFGDERFLTLPEAVGAALEQLPEALESYRRLEEVWPLAVKAAQLKSAWEVPKGGQP